VDQVVFEKEYFSYPATDVIVYFTVMDNNAAPEARLPDIKFFKVNVFLYKYIAQSGLVRCVCFLSIAGRTWREG